jgi:hypothetical protein
MKSVKHEKGNFLNPSDVNPVDALVESSVRAGKSMDTFNSAMSGPNPVAVGACLQVGQRRNEMLGEFIQRNPRFLAMLNEFYKHGEEGKKTLDELVNMSGRQVQVQSAPGKLVPAEVQK